MAEVEVIYESSSIWDQKDRPRHIDVAIEYGQIIPDKTFEDYLKLAVDKNGYETIGIHGTQGSGKSCFALQIAAWVLLDVLLKKLDRVPTKNELWEAVLDSLVFKPKDFVKKLESVPRGERLPIVIWDDIGVHYTSSTFKTDIEQYAAIDSTWAAIRTKVGVVIVTIPIINRLAKNVKDNLTFEVFIGRNQMVQVRRLFYLPGLSNIDSNLFKPQIETPHVFDLYEVPKWVWDRYWEMRLNLTEEALAALKGATDMGEDEGYIPILEASKLIQISPNTIQQMGSRGVIETKKIKGKLWVFKEDCLMVKELESMRGRKTKNQVLP